MHSVTLLDKSIDFGTPFKRTNMQFGINMNVAEVSNERKISNIGRILFCDGNMRVFPILGAD